MMSIRYVIHDVDVGSDDLGDGTAWPGLAPATRAALRMQGIGEIGAVMLVPCAGAPLLVTTGFGQSRPDLAYPLFWIKRSRALAAIGGAEERLTRLEWEPVTGAAPAGTLPNGMDLESGENELTCLEVELCQVLMMLTIECGRRGLNRSLPAHLVEWYVQAEQKPAPELVTPLFAPPAAGCEVAPRSGVWTRRAAECYAKAAAAAEIGRAHV